MSARAYLEELDAKATDWPSRVQIACAQAIVEAIQEQTVLIETARTLLTPRHAEDPAFLSREAFLRRLHGLADSSPSLCALSEHEIALADHDAACRRILDGR